jgi:hypothetical protein
VVALTAYWLAASCLFRASTCEFEVEGCSAHILVAAEDQLCLVPGLQARLTIDLLDRLVVHALHGLEDMGMLVLEVGPCWLIRLIQLDQSPTHQHCLRDV